MNREELGDWIQIIATIGVIAGLALVAFEIKQNTNLTRAEMNAQQIVHLQNLHSSFREPEFAIVFRKAIDRAESLTPEEALMIDGHFRDLILLLTLERTMIQRGVFEDTSGFWADFIVRHGIGLKYGQQWWLRNKETVSPGAGLLIDKSIERLESGHISLVHEQ